MVGRKGRLEDPAFPRFDRCLTGPACVDAVSPAMAPTVAPTRAPHLRQQPQKTYGKLTALGVWGSRGWEAVSGGATPPPDDRWGRSPGPPHRQHVE